MLVGLDYRYVASHHTYQQTLWQTFRSAQRLNAGHLLLGMSADLQKSRFGAKPRRRWVYVQPTDTYNNDSLLQLAEQVSTVQPSATRPAAVRVSTASSSRATSR